MSLSEIRFLTKEEIQKIAAGEVVERPASIVKELVENSIDAKSSFIKINIKDGGISKIEIEDDGIGMSLEDMQKAILPHTTSKLPSVNTLYNDGIKTYGFRGEALSSIVSISNTKIFSKKENFEPYEITINSGEIISKNIKPRNLGTTICIEDIFSSIPARKKFLKSKETEWNAIEHILIGCGLSAPNVRFSIYHNNNSIFEWPAAENIIERAFSIVPEKYLNNMIECDFYDGYLKLKGIISGIEYGHYDRSKIYVLVNNRIVRQYKITQAITKSYASDSFIKRYPMAFLSINVPEKDVDVNVHPRKEEVAFNFPKKVENAISEGIFKALEKRTKKLFTIENEGINLENKNIVNFEKKEDLKINDFNLNQNIKNEKEIIKNNFTNNDFISKNNFYDNKKTFAVYDLEEVNFNELKKNKNENNLNFIKEDLIEKKEENKVLENKNLLIEEIYQTSFLKNDEIQSLNKPKYGGVFAKTYLTFFKEESILFIDQHALHERVIYEKIKNEANENFMQSFFSPKIFVFDKSTINLIERNLDIFNSCGINIEIFDESTIIIRACSKYIKIIGLDFSINEILQSLSSNNIEKTKEDLLKKVLGDVACKKAVKAGDILSNDEINLLLNNSQYHECVSLCPHGRPTYYTLNKYELDKLFKRK